VLPGQDITTTIWKAGPNLFAFETTVDGVAVIKDGLAEISNA
jgi:hypothetical protein